jgi:hypothetical protein
MILITEVGEFGPFKTIEQLADRWRCDGVDYPFTVVGMTETGDAPEPEPPAPSVDMPALRQRLMAAVDDRIAAIYARWTRFETEYTARETAARAFAAVEYEGEASVWVSSFAMAAGLANAAAADLIIEQADGLHAALELLGALRMRKYEIAGAEDVVRAQAAHDDIVAQANAIEAGL